MIDVKQPLLKALFAKLNDLGESCFTRQVPDTESVANYILIERINIVNTSTANSNDVRVSATIKISTYKDKYNNGADCDRIANLVLNSLDNQPLEINSEIQCVSCKFANDNETYQEAENVVVYVERTINFNLFLYIKN